MSILAINLPQGGELIIIVVAVLVLFGSTKIPHFARSLGQAQREFRKGTTEELEEETTSTKSDKPTS